LSTATEPDGAIRKLTRQRFEAVIIDCTDLKAATSVLKSARSAPANKRCQSPSPSWYGHNGLRSAFDMGAHFVLYKPVSKRAGQIELSGGSRSDEEGTPP